MNKHQIEYTANYGRYRNQSGNWLYQDLLNEPSPQCKSRKKQYPTKKCLIEKYQMLNVGQSYLPKVDDLILNVSDIQGTHTDTIKSDAVRNRLIAKQIRQTRETLEKEAEAQAKIESKRKITPIFTQSIPKKSYHISPKYALESRIQTEGDATNDNKQKRLQRILTLPNQSINTDKLLNNAKKTLKESSTLPTIQHNPQKLYSKHTLQVKKQSFIESSKNTLQLDDLEQKVMNLKRQQVVQVKRQTPRNFSDSNRHRRSKLQSDLANHRIARINPTFLSYGSQYLYNGNNYLASYGRNSILY